MSSYIIQETCQTHDLSWSTFLSKVGKGAGSCQGSALLPHHVGPCGGKRVVWDGRRAKRLSRGGCWAGELVPVNRVHGVQFRLADGVWLEGRGAGEACGHVSGQSALHPRTLPSLCSPPGGRWQWVLAMLQRWPCWRRLCTREAARLHFLPPCAVSCGFSGC